jgi:hypothetical protein
MKKILILSVMIVSPVLCTSAEAVPFCRTIKTCEQAVQDCIAFRVRRQIPASELTCEASGAVCRSTGIWRGRYTRGTREIQECRFR